MFYVLSSFRWIKDDLFFLKSNANLVINTTCVLLYISRALYIFECKNCVQDLFLGELFQAMISLARD
jgi:hypothetical protein